jgi:hypothetical protein
VASPGTFGYIVVHFTKYYYSDHVKEKVFIGKLEQKRLYRRSRLTWEDNIKLDLREIGWEVVDWMQTSAGSSLTS